MIPHDDSKVENRQIVLCRVYGMMWMSFSPQNKDRGRGVNANDADKCNVVGDIIKGRAG